MRRSVVSVVTPPADLLPLATVKGNLRVAWADEDATIQGYIDAAVAILDGPIGRLGRAVMLQSWKHVCIGPIYGCVMLTAEPVEITSILYLDTDEVEQTADVADFRVESDGYSWAIVPRTGKAWPEIASWRYDAMRIVYTTGFPSADAVPAPIKQAVQLLVGHWYKERETATAATLKEMPFAVEALIGDYKIGFVA